MRTKYYTAVFITCLFFLNACTKSTTISKFIANPILDKFTTSVNFDKVDTGMVSQLLSITANERNLMLNQLEKNYPGLKSEMEKDMNSISAQTDTSKQIQMLADFKQLYYAKVKNSWNIAGISLSDLTIKYSKILGTIPFKVGEFGDIIVTRGGSSENIPVFPDDSTWKKNSWNSFSQSNSSDRIANDIIGPRVNLSQAFLGHDRIESLNFSTTILPNNVYQYLSYTNKLQRGRYHTIAFAGIAGASATLSLSLALRKDGVSLNTRDILYLSSIAPIIWYSETNYFQALDTEYSISIRNAEGLEGGNYECMQTMVNTASVFGLGASISSGFNYTKEIKGQMTR